MLIIIRGKKPVSQNGTEEEVLEQFQQARFVHLKILSKMEKVLLCFQTPLNPSKEVSSSNVSCKLWLNLSFDERNGFWIHEFFRRRSSFDGK